MRDRGTARRDRRGRARTTNERICRDGPRGYGRGRWREGCGPPQAAEEGRVILGWLVFYAVASGALALAGQDDALPALRLAAGAPAGYGAGHLASRSSGARATPWPSSCSSRRWGR